MKFFSPKILSVYINKVILTGDSRLQIPQQLMNIATNENMEASEDKAMMVVKLGWISRTSLQLKSVKIKHGIEE